MYSNMIFSYHTIFVLIMSALLHLFPITLWSNYIVNKIFAVLLDIRVCLQNQPTLQLNSGMFCPLLWTSVLCLVVVAPTRLSLLSPTFVPCSSKRLLSSLIFFFFFFFFLPGSNDQVHQEGGYLFPPCLSHNGNIFLRPCLGSIVFSCPRASVF